MKCDSCGAEISQGEQFCKVCGAKVYTSSVNHPIYMNQNVISSTPNSNPNQTSGVQMNLNSLASDVTDDEKAFIDAYIGSHVEKMKSGGFSFCTLFFGASYIVYRKMWALAFLWMIISLLTLTFLPDVSFIILFVFQVVLSIRFKKLYMKKVQKQVYHIRTHHTDMTRDQLLLMCHKKGGTSVLSVIVYILLMGVLLWYLSMNSYFYGSMGNLSFKVPSRFQKNAVSSDSFENYILGDDATSCSLVFTLKDKESYSSAGYYLTGSVYRSDTDTMSEVQTETINDVEWSFVTVTNSFSKSYYYAVVREDKIYELEFDTFGDNSDCMDSYHNVVLPSLRFRVR